jgi:hypothetical protein
LASSFETKRDRRLAARTERQRRASEGRRKAELRRRFMIAALVVLVVAILGGAGYMISQSASQPRAPGRVVADEGRNHLNPGAPLRFQHNPPTSGSHYGSWTRPGVYTEPQSPGNWVHSLEHGYVVILYRPGDGEQFLSQLRQFYEAAPASQKYRYQKLVVTPYEDMERPLAVLAWNHIDEMDQFDRERLLAFYRAYLDKGPEDAN